ncbi:MAG: hypothetical protein NTX51_18320, partial [Verrucomicrobia bacterium]|nr:hypothetical protein [Verrucomicrobiota bacterium]
MTDSKNTSDASVGNRRAFLIRTGTAALAAAAAPLTLAQTNAPTKASDGGTIIDFERELKR